LLYQVKSPSTRIFNKNLAFCSKPFRAYEEGLKPSLQYNKSYASICRENFSALYILKKMSLQLQIDYPEMLPDALAQSRQQFEEEAKWAMAVKLFELKRISSGTAALLVGVDRVSFLLKLKDYGVPTIDLTEEELLSDLKNA
jgi:predicted HTH domain antitoxin